MKVEDFKLTDCSWINISAPTVEKLQEIAQQYDLKERLVLNCLDPDYLPSAELDVGYKFVMLRVSEDEVALNADTIQELTTKIALFIKDKTIISIHRLELSNLIEQVQGLIQANKHRSINTQYMLRFFLEVAVKTFDKPTNALDIQTERFEDKIFNSDRPRDLLKEGFDIKRKASSYRKILKLTSDVYNKIQLTQPMPNSAFLKERIDSNVFYAEDNLETIQTLLNLHIAIQSQKINEASFRTNEIMRVLTVLTIFFSPLNFIAGIYGMNFDVIPLAKNPQGFWISIGIMFTVCLILSIYVAKKGWLSQPPKK